MGLGGLETPIVLILLLIILLVFGQDVFPA